jgi:hypothetical protein
MAKGQKRSGREAKKPKSDKKNKPATVTTAFTEPPSKKKPTA